MRVNFDCLKLIIDKLAIIFSFLKSGSDYEVVVERKEKKTTADSSSIDDTNSID